MSARLDARGWVPWWGTENEGTTDWKAAEAEAAETTPGKAILFPLPQEVTHVAKPPEEVDCDTSNPSALEGTQSAGVPERSQVL